MHRRELIKHLLASTEDDGLATVLIETRVDVYEMMSVRYDPELEAIVVSSQSESEHS